MENKRKDELFAWFTTNNSSGYKSTEKWLKEHENKLYVKIIEFTKNIDLSFKEKISLFLIDSKTIPLCPECGKECKFKGSIKKGFAKYCSSTCSNKSKDVITKKIEKYKSLDYQTNRQKKIAETNLKKYGTTCVLNNSNIRKKIKQTNLKLYGVENVFASEKIINKIKETNLKKYGVTHLSKDKEFQKRKSEIITLTMKNKFIKILSERLNLDIENIEVDNEDITLSNFCKIHEKFTINKNNFYSRTRLNTNLCTECYSISDLSSISENEVLNYIRKITRNEKINKNRINNSEIDIFIPEKNMGIEFDGLYWHSNLFHDKNYHLNKTKLADENNIQLLHIFEDEWVYKRDIVKSIIKSKLGLLSDKIFARKCKILEITDNQLVKAFLEENHIQGFVGSKVKLGLYYNEELVSLMTFGKTRLSMGSKKQEEGVYEMIRFCNKLNINVIGGASKLLKYFIRNYNPKRIITYADRRYSNGNLYNKIGFEKVGYSEPNYWYFKRSDLKRHYRFKFRKDVLVKEGYDPNKTEKEIMSERKYNWIYDCGNIKYEMVLI